MKRYLKYKSRKFINEICVIIKEIPEHRFPDLFGPVERNKNSITLEICFLN